MSKAHADTRFRKIDVDSYNDDNYQDPDDSGDGSQQKGIDVQAIESFMQTGKAVDALLCVLNGSFTQKNEAVKNRETECCLKVLSGFKVSEMEAFINKLDSKQVDFLMKIIYRGFSSPVSDSGSVAASLLSWHEKVVKVGGSGCIVRVITDRNK